MKDRMTDPTRDPALLVSEGASDFERRWLSAARAEEPPPAVVARIEQALGLGAATPASPAPPAEVAKVAAKVTGKGGLSALRIAGLSALGVGGTVGLVLLLSRPAAPPAVPPAPVAPIAEPEATPAAGAQATTPPPATPAPATLPVTAAGALRDEIALIDGARAALAAGSSNQALSLLERYRARHPHGMLLPEALAMRIEAIDRGGDHARARSLASAFLAQYPHSPLAQRVAHIAAH